MRDDLLGWQWSHYPAGHTTRATLLVHLFAVPLFWFGALALPLAPLAGTWSAAATSAGTGLVAMLVALALQGRAHRREPRAPEPFLGPLDVVSRLLVEQWITFPRFVLSGGFSRAWRAAGEPPHAP